MKKKILVDLPDNLIDTETKKLIKSQASKITRLETKVQQLLSIINNDRDIIAKAKQLVEACRQAGDFRDDDEYGDQL